VQSFADDSEPPAAAPRINVPVATGFVALDLQITTDIKGTAYNMNHHAEGVRANYF